MELYKHSHFSGKCALILSTWFGAGLFPVAPGTAGTLTAVPFAAAMMLMGPWARASVLLILILIGIWAAERTQAIVKEKDPSVVVIDEVVGFMIAFVFLPLSWWSLVLAFFLFRFFDILKPFPVRHLERLKGGLGIVMDDLLAGVYASAIVWAALIILK